MATPDIKTEKTVLYAASVASFDEDNGELTAYCCPCLTAEDAVEWVRTDWNDQANLWNGKKFTKAQAKKLLAELKDNGYADLDGPAEWGVWHRWRIESKEV